MEADSTEAVYSTNDDVHIMSERIQSLAASIYKEFERLIVVYDENVVKELMPLVISVLENLDQTLQERQEIEVELELLREDNEQLMTQYEREKQLRKSAEQRMLGYEDAYDEDRRHLQDKLESLESIVRMFDIKMKNAQEQITRLEERDTESKAEYAKLHQRYNDLFKAHMDYIDRSQLMNSMDRSQENFSTPIKRVSTHGLEGRETPTADMFEADMQPLNEGAIAVVRGSDDGSLYMSSFSFQPDIKSRMEMSTRTGADRTKNVMTFEDMTMSDQNSLTDSIPDEGMMHNESDFVSFTNKVADLPAFGMSDELSNESGLVTGLMDFGADLIDDESDKQSIGVSREVDNLIKENNELLATKNALNVVKDDLIQRVDELAGEKDILREEVNSLEVVKLKLRARISELEEEVKKMRSALEEQVSRQVQSANDDESDVPASERKRFTRVEMARVLLERNQYKERLMELQEAVRWTEMVRASREISELNEVTKKKSSFWDFKLFSSTRSSKKQTQILPPVSYSESSTDGVVVKPVGDPNRPYRERNGNQQSTKAFHFLQDDLNQQEMSTLCVQNADNDNDNDCDVADNEDDGLTEKARQLRQQERRQQRQRAWARREAMMTSADQNDAQAQAYGWSLPAKFNVVAHHGVGVGGKILPQPTVPVPVYCRPVEDDVEIRLWCATAINVSGGFTKDGGTIYGASSFYSDSCEKTDTRPEPPVDEVDRLNQELQDHEKGVSDLENQQMSSLVWICSTTPSHSFVTVIDANSPGDVLEKFVVSESPVRCIASVPGALESDYVADSEENEAATTLDSSSNGATSTTSTGTVEASGSASSSLPKSGSDTILVEAGQSLDNGDNANTRRARTLSAAAAVSASLTNSRRFVSTQQKNCVNDGTSLPEGLDSVVQQQLDEHVLLLPTVWLGTDDGWLFVHSAVCSWKRRLYAVNLSSPIIAISHIKSRIFVALGNGTTAVFQRATSGEWNIGRYQTLNFGDPSSICCYTVVANQRLWYGHRNRVYIRDPKSLVVEATFDAHPRPESHIQHMVWVGEGVWLSIRLDSTLRLYHAYTYQHLQDVDVEPHVSKLLGVGKLGFSFVRITSLDVACRRLWVGTGNGVIMSIPLSESVRQSALLASSLRPTEPVRVYGNNKTESVFPGSYIPYCNIAQAQLSFHGHKDAVKFFIIVPGLPSKCLSGISGSSAASSRNIVGTKELTKSDALQKTVLVISGGEGYIDFRIGDVEDDDDAGADGSNKLSTFMKGDRSYLIVWQMFSDV